jgi:hypothetical protein
MNLRPSNLEQGPGPVAVSRDGVVSKQDAFPPVPAVQTFDSQRPSVNRAMAFVYVLAGGLTVFWGALLVWLVFKAFSLTIG